jgi:hypothetical protein
MEPEKIVRLTNNEYAAFTAEAKQTGQELEDLIHEALDEYLAKRIRLSIKASHTPTRREISEILYYGGLTERIPSGRMLSKEEEAERQRLADLFGQAGGKLASEMVIEDRGPY